MTGRVVLDQLVLGESPRWHDGRVWVCDWGRGDVLSLAENGGDVRVEGHVASMPVCIDWEPDGSLLVVSGGQRLLLVQDEGSLVTRCDLSVLLDQPWNEVVSHPRGFSYVNSVGFDLMAGDAPASGVVALVADDGTARIVAGDLAFPNGMAVSDDGRALLVAESYAGCVTAFDIAADGTLSNRRVWAEVPDSAPDGICWDAEGALWYADVPNRRCVRVVEGGDVREVVASDRGCFSCTLGGADGRTLFVAVADWPPAPGTTPSGQLIAHRVAVPAVCGRAGPAAEA
jgi:sugar lactone lactonase YvrE